MVQLISKGGFRERANRSPKYQNSENQQTILSPTHYSNNQVQKKSYEPDPSEDTDKNEVIQSNE